MSDARLAVVGWLPVAANLRVPLATSTSFCFSRTSYTNSPSPIVSAGIWSRMGAQVSCLPRSGQPGESGDSVTPDLEPADPAATGDGPVRFVEIIDGDKRRVIAVPDSD